MDYDVAIIGGGPAGYVAAENAASHGLKTILFEKNQLGGVCLHEGCIPTKSLLYSAKVLDTVRSASKYGIVAEQCPAVDLKKIFTRKSKIVRKLTAGIKQKLAAAGVVLTQGVASVVGEYNGLIEIACATDHYFCKNLLICTGSETVIPSIKGLNNVDYWTSREALMEYPLPATLSIIGGGVIGMEFASLFNSLGVKVSVVETLPEILGNMDSETCSILRTEYLKRGINFHLESTVLEVTSECVVVKTKDGLVSIPSEKVLVCVGRRATFSELGLENLGVKTAEQGILTNEFLQTNDPRVYACGDVNGKSLLAHTAIREAEVAINRILGIKDQMSYKAIPNVVYTNPEIAGVGQTEWDLIAKRESFRVVKLPMAFSGRFVAENEAGNGLCKLIINQEKQIVGCHIVGNPASELIAIAGMAIDTKMSLSAFRRIVFPHPTVAEILHEVAKM